MALARRRKRLRLTSFLLSKRDGFEFVLARDLGMTVGELDRRMSHMEYREWQAFYIAENARRKQAEKARK